MTKIEEAESIIFQLGFPSQQQNERSALTLLALLNLSPERSWEHAEAPLMGVTPIMDWMRDKYGKEYKPNTRETVRRQTLHQFVDAGFVLYNPDDPKRPVNSPKAVYQIEEEALELIHHFGTDQWEVKLEDYLSKKQSLAHRYARERDQQKIALVLPDEGHTLKLSPGKHSQLIKDIIEDFATRNIDGAELIYAGDTGDKIGFFDHKKLASLGVSVDKHGKMPDVVIYDRKRNWLILAEAVTSHGPVDPKRHGELEELFAGCQAGLVFLTAFPNMSLFARYATQISWETEVWVADNPSHIIHFNGSRFLGPYEKE